jgi:predicted GIY-YIG superfamily endonuclease
MTDICYVYWIHLPEYTDVLSQGYVGISKKPRQRFQTHLKRPENAKMKNYIRKHPEAIMTVLLKSTRMMCEQVEKKLRPDKGIGWNIAIGGGTTPSQKNIPKNSLHKRRIGDGNRGKVHEYLASYNRDVKSKQMRGTVWYYDPLTKVSKYFIPGTQPEHWIKGRYSRTRVS